MDKTFSDLGFQVESLAILHRFNGLSERDAWARAMLEITNSVLREESVDVVANRAEVLLFLLKEYDGIVNYLGTKLKMSGGNSLDSLAEVLLEMVVMTLANKVTNVFPGSDRIMEVRAEVLEVITGLVKEAFCAGTN